MHESRSRQFVLHRMSVDDHLISSRKHQLAIDFPSEIGCFKKVPPVRVKKPTVGRIWLRSYFGYSFDQFLVSNSESSS